MDELKSKIKEAVKVAMKNRDSLTTETLRGLLAEIQYNEIQKGTENLADNLIIDVIKSEIKKRREQLEFSEKGGRSDMTQKAQAEIVSLERFLPKQMNEAELSEAIKKFQASTPGANMGAVMKALKDTYPGLYDSKLASELAKKLTS